MFIGVIWRHKHKFGYGASSKYMVHKYMYENPNMAVAR